MTDQEILSGLAEIIEEIAGTPADEVTPEANFVDDLDIDSLSMVEIAVAAQDKFGVEIPDEQLKDLKTVQDVVNFVSKNSQKTSSKLMAAPSMISARTEVADPCALLGAPAAVREASAPQPGVRGAPRKRAGDRPARWRLHGRSSGGVRGRPPAETGGCSEQQRSSRASSSLGSARPRRSAVMSRQPGRRCSRGPAACAASPSRGSTSCRSRSPRLPWPTRWRSSASRRLARWTGTSSSRWWRPARRGPTPGRPQVDPYRLGVAVTSGIGGIGSTLTAYDTLSEKGWNRISPFTVPMLMPNGAAGWISIEFGARAGAHALVSACASGAEAIGYGIDMIRSGRADVVIAGGAEAAIMALNIGAFAVMRAMSTRNDEPERASRPFDKGRDGFVLGEGAGIVILESQEHALARGARIYAVAAGAGYTSDGYHISHGAPDGSGDRACDPVLPGRRGVSRRPRSCTSTRTPRPLRKATRWRRRRSQPPSATTRRAASCPPPSR